jgi:lysophospholipid acyltransferase (LPLAT)-like uncharacterized protein
VAHNVYLMPEFQHDTGIASRKNHAALLQAFARTKQVNISKGIGRSEAYVSRLKDGELLEIAKLLAVCGLKVVPEEMVVLDRRQIDALVHLTQELNRGPVDER